MCELFVLSSKRSERKRVQLDEFFSHSKTNPDGWGLFWMEGTKGHLVKEPTQASKSALLKETLATLPQSSLVFAHIREATSGVSLASCHPFQAKDSKGTTWTLMHNGYLLSELQTVAYRELQAGDTDSERVFLYMIDALNKELYKTNETPDVFEKLACLQGAVELLADGGANKLNLILTDGEYVYVHTNTKEATLHWKKGVGEIMIATTKLDKSSWGELPRNTFMAFKEGELVAKTLPHRQTFRGGHPISFEKACANGLKEQSAA